MYKDVRVGVDADWDRGEKIYLEGDRGREGTWIDWDQGEDQGKNILSELGDNEFEEEDVQDHLSYKRCGELGGERTRWLIIWDFIGEWGYFATYNERAESSSEIFGRADQKYLP